MNILFVNEKCGYFGGIEQNVADTAAGLRARGHACSLAFQESTGRQVDEYQSRFDQCVPMRPLAAAVARVRPDVIYIHKANLRPLGEAPDGVRQVRMVHDHDLCCPRRHKYYAWNGRICRQPAGWRCYLDLAFLGRGTGPVRIAYTSIGDKMREMRRNHALALLLVGSEAMRRELLQNGFSPEKVSILPPVVRMQERTMSPIPGENRILYVGQLIRGKGVDLLLHALPHVTRDFELTIVGSGNARSSLEQLCGKLGIAGKVRFVGWVNPQELGSYYAAAKLVAVPSRWPEPFGMIGLEAMHYGRPVAAFDVGGIPDWLEHGVTGLLAPEGDVRALAAAIDQLLGDPDLCTRLGSQAQERVRTKFAFDDYLDRLEGFLS
ncbi:MAG TPA: glycosyltransferase family 4 protein [Candidatus Acidoferrales bacterium]|nr:glycosyltransferase family 4 protein [Candidatus Acidoferrales bacterium]